MSASRLFPAIAIAAAAGLSGVLADAAPLRATTPEAPPPIVSPVAANCYAVGQKMASQKGGQLMQASQTSRGGKTMCHIVIRIPGNDGQRPRRAEFTVPAN